MNTPAILIAVTAIGFGGGFALQSLTQRDTSARDDAVHTLAPLEEPPSGSRRITIESSDPDLAHKIEAVLATALGDPRSAIRQAEELGVSGTAVPEIVRAWAIRNIESALEWALSIPDSGRRREAIEHIFEALVEQGQVDVALRYLETLPAGSLRDEAAAEVVEGLVATDAETALSLATSMSDGDARREAARDISEHFVTSGTDAEFWAIYESLAIGSFSNRLAEEYLEEMAEVDPGRAIATAQAKAGLFDRETLSEMFEEMGEELGRNDPRGGLALASQIQDPAMRREFLRELGEEWGEEAPQAASEWLLAEMRRTGNTELHPILSGAIEELLEWDQELSFSLIDQIPAAEVRREVELDAIREISGDNPRLASSRLGEIIARDPALDGGTARRLTDNWLRRDPAGASAWVDHLPAGPSKDAGIVSLVRYSVEREQDIQAARAWIGQMSSEDAKQEIRQWVRQEVD